jgi:hypothetical protein
LLLCFHLTKNKKQNKKTFNLKNFGVEYKSSTN